MAYYPPGYVERIRLIKRLQEERFMPLGVIKRMLDDDPGRAARLVELEDRILERAVTAQEGAGRIARREAVERFDVPDVVLERLEEIEVLSPNRRGYDPDDVEIIAADRKRTRLNSSHSSISYADFCL